MNCESIKFTPNFSWDAIEFLDLLISHDKYKFITATHFKKVDSNSYLDFNSGHFHKWKKNVPFGQFRRIRKNCTEDATYEEQAHLISQRFIEKGYPKGLIKEASNKARNLIQDQCLTTKTQNTDEKKERINFITAYNKSFTKICGTLQKHWHVLLKDPYLKTILAETPNITYRRPPTLKKPPCT